MLSGISTALLGTDAAVRAIKVSQQKKMKKCELKVQTSRGGGSTGAHNRGSWSLLRFEEFLLVGEQLFFRRSAAQLSESRLGARHSIRGFWHCTLWRRVRGVFRLVSVCFKLFDETDSIHFSLQMASQSSDANCEFCRQCIFCIMI
jgi:hypothetical protein